VAYFKLLASLVFLAIALTLFYDFIMERSSSLGFGPTQSGAANSAQERLQTVQDVTLTGFAILLGITFGSVYDKLKGKLGRVEVLKELLETFQSSRFLISLLIAPLIFAGVYVAAKSQPDRVVAFLFAFQNGFFCDSIFRRGHAQS
jgi:hypothetical protein